MPPLKSRKYCCICSKYRGKIVNGTPVSLHRFPVNNSIRRIWIQRSKLIRKDFVYNNNCYMCSLHFVGMRGPTKDCQLPSMFPQRTFKTSTVGNDFSNTPTIHIPMDCQTSPLSSPAYSNTTLCTNRSNLETSVLLHDYCGTVDTQTLTLNNHQEVQTYNSSKEVGVQCTKFTYATVSVGTQTETIRVETVDMGTQVRRPCLTYEDVKDDKDKLMFYTGIPDSGTFDALFDELKDSAECHTSRNGSSTDQGRPRHLRIIDEIFLVLMGLRLGLFLEDLADRFYISKATCCVIFNKWIDYLEAQLSFLIKWPCKKAVMDHMLQQFSDKYPHCRVILDCTELRTETPSSLQYKSLMYSDYKSHMTWKGLVGISPAGVVTFVSDLWAGSVSDKVITRESGLLELCEPGDAIMVDKGFLISDMTTPRGIHLIIPPFKHQKQQLSKREVEETRTIANLRIHVERQMERIKNFAILRTVMPISMSSRVSKIWKICSCLTNLQPPLVLN